MVQLVNPEPGNLLRSIDIKTIRRYLEGIEKRTACSLYSNTPFYKQTKWFEIAFFYIIFFPKNIF